MRAVRIEFANPDSTGTHQLYYVSLDATDKALEFYPDFLTWISQYKPATVLLKSASYLLHDSQFAKTRSMLLERPMLWFRTTPEFRTDSSVRIHGR